ncbi:MAG: ATP synthase subunit I [Thermodesulfobacteriota bacterium]|nr:ATP synthase subunit I [Thermodesulfobacteriota bacterium]
MNVSIEQHILNFVTRSNWTLFFCLAVPGAIYLDPMFVSGFICGALIVTINFHLLVRTLKNAFVPDRVVSRNTILAKYYLRFFVTGLLLFVLIAGRLVDPLGLIIGLSVVVISLFLATLVAIKKLIFKEAI